MKIRRFRLRGAPRFPVVVEPPPSAATVAFCGKISAEFRALLARAVNRIDPADEAVQAELEALRADPYRPARDLFAAILDGRPLITIVPMLGPPKGPKCHGEF